MDANVEKDAKVHCATVAMVTTRTHCVRTESDDVTYLVYASPLLSTFSVLQIVLSSCSTVHVLTGFLTSDLT